MPILKNRQEIDKMKTFEFNINLGNVKIDVIRDERGIRATVDIQEAK